MCVCDGDRPKERLRDEDLESNERKSYLTETWKETEHSSITQRPNADPGPARICR